MTDPIVELPVIQFDQGRAKQISAPIIREQTLELWVNGSLLVEIACAGIHLEELALGFLKSEGLVDSMKDVVYLERKDDPPGVFVTTTNPDRDRKSATAIMSSGARNHKKTLPPEPVESAFVIAAQQALSLMEQLLAATEIHEITRGTHCSALADAERLLCLREDIGRHNTIDMLAGYALMHEMKRGFHALLTTGRISSEITGKAWIQGIPVVISHSAPTSGAIDLARRAGITLIGYVRNGRMGVYTNEKRVLF